MTVPLTRRLPDASAQRLALTEMRRRISAMERPSWDQYFMTITRQVAERSTCLRAKVGAVIVRDRSILATGYNGSPAGLPHCLDVGCLIYESRNPDGEIEQNCYRTIHAEINAITQAARNGARFATPIFTLLTRRASIA